jgi:hypothetical protein
VPWLAVAAEAALCTFIRLSLRIFEESKTCFVTFRRCIRPTMKVGFGRTSSSASGERDEPEPVGELRLAESEAD